MQFESIGTFCHTKTRYSLKVFLPDFVTSCLKMYLRKYLKQFSRERLDIVHNVLILPRPKIPQGSKCNNILKPKNTPGGDVLIP